MKRPLAVLPAPRFDLRATLQSGQAFHWLPEGAGYVGAIGGRAVYVEQRGGELWVTRGGEEAARHYFALDHPLAEIHASFPTDEAMQRAVASAPGLRILRQPLWECVATFITSSMKQVAHIAQISHTLRERYGERLEVAGRAVFAYPTPHRLAEATEADLRACALGYRAPNLLRSAGLIARGEVNLETIRDLPFEVGEKVANCALLFAFERLEAFPIDVWIKRVLRTIYFAGRREVTAARLREFSAGYFGAYGGYAQQYLFHYARTIAPPPPRRKTRRPS
jgi:N-glycosylase/DNA lyase